MAVSCMLLQGQSYIKNILETELFTKDLSNKICKWNLYQICIHCMYCNSSPLFLIAGAYTLINEKSDQNMSLKDSLWHFFDKILTFCWKLRGLNANFRKKVRTNLTPHGCNFTLLRKRKCVVIAWKSSPSWETNREYLWTKTFLMWNNMYLWLWFSQIYTFYALEW